MTEGTSPAAPVRRRKVLYLSGHDPYGSGKYHAIYRKEAARQGRTAGYDISVGDCSAIDACSDHWTVRAVVDGTACETDYEFLRWDDIAAAHWHGGHANYLRMTTSSTWATLKNGVLLRLCKTSLPLFSIFIYPPALLAILALLALALFAGLLFVADLPPWLAWALFAVAGTALVVLNRHAETAWHMGWLMRAWWYIRHQACSDWPDLDARLDAHARRLVHILSEPEWDEVLVVGHCWGATMAVHVLARTHAIAPQALRQTRLNFLTLANCFPLLSYQPEARYFRDELVTVAEQLDGRWIDFTAPADRACAALTDPLVAVRHIGPPSERSLRQVPGTKGPKLLNARFHQLFPPAPYALLRKDLYQMHFQYLKASPLNGEYDFFAITAGTQSLVQRFAARASQDDFTDLQCFGGPFAR